MRQIIATLPLLLISLLLSLHTQARPLVVDENTMELELADHLLYLEDPSGTMDLDQIQRTSGQTWQHSGHDVFSQGYSDSAWWLQISLHNTSSASLNRLLEISYPVLDYIQVFVLSDSGTDTYRLGDKYPFSERPLDHRNFVIPLSWEAQETLTIYLRVKSSSSIQIPLTLWEERRFHSHDQVLTLGHGIYFGIMLVMILYNLFVFLNLLERTYIYYVAFVISMPFFLASLNGFAFQYLWPNATRWNDQAILISLSMSVVFGCFFIQNFLHLYEQRGIFSTLGYQIAAINAGLALLSFFLPYHVVIKILIPSATIACIYGLSMGMLRWQTGGSSARYFTVAWTAFLTGGVVLALNKYNILPKNTFTEYATQIGSAIEVTLLSFALAVRLNQERQMRSEAQQVALNTERQLRQAREEALESQIQAKETLEERVKARTLELEALNRKLEQMSDTDQLTGLSNRRYLDRAMTEEISRCRRYGHFLSLIILDIDHFKTFNDNHGHLVGDDCLRQVARHIKMSLRWPSDQATRYGGEEFCILLPETPVEGGMAVAERIRSNIESMDFQARGDAVSVTVSAGVVSLIPDEDTDGDALISMADQALYASKQAGRNRVTLHPRPAKER